MDSTISSLTETVKFFPPQKKTTEGELKSPFKLYSGPVAQKIISTDVASHYPNRTYQVNPLSSLAQIKKDLTMEVIANRFLIVDQKEGKPYVDGTEPGLIILMRSATHLGACSIQKDIKPLESALQKMQNLSPGKFTLFMIGGKASDSKLHDSACRFIQNFNIKYQRIAMIADDLFQAFDFPKLEASAKRLDVHYVGFDMDNHPIAIIDIPSKNI